MLKSPELFLSTKLKLLSIYYCYSVHTFIVYYFVALSCASIAKDLLFYTLLILFIIIIIIVCNLA